MNKTIHGLNSLAQAQADDELIIYDVSEGESKKIQVQDLNNPNYSETEQKTGGTWIDGKPIYRKVWTGLSVGVSSGSWQNLNLSNLPSIDNLIKGVAIRSATGDKYVYNFISFRWNNSNLYYKSTNAENAITDVIIEYTKTTD